MKLRGLTILITEDEPLIAMDVADTLEAAGAAVRGPLRSVEEAASLIGETSPADEWDAVVLDYGLKGGTSEAFAVSLKERGIPFVLHTGLPQKARPLAERLDVPLVSKPAAGGSLVAAIGRAIDREGR